MKKGFLYLNKKSLVLFMIVFFSACMPSQGDFAKQGDVYLKKGDYRKAVDAYREAIQIDFDNADTYANLGLAYKNLGWNEEAKRSFRKAKELFLKKNDPQQARFMGKLISGLK